MPKHKTASHRKAVYAGSFDPITSGHMEIVRRSLRLVDRLVIGPATSSGKGPLFSLEERVEIMSEDIADFPQADRERITIVPFDGLLIHFAKKVNASLIIRGLRAVSDFEYETQMANMNARMEPDIETIFLMPHEAYAYLSSRLIKEIALLGGDIRPFVPDYVERAIRRKFGK